MELDLRELTRYEQRISEENARIAEEKRLLEHYRLQAKQTREMIAVAKKHETLRAFIKAMPKDCVEVTPAPGTIYASITLSVMGASLYREAPERLGLIPVETRPIDESLGSPILRTYRSEDKRVQFFITSRVR